MFDATLSVISDEILNDDTAAVSVLYDELPSVAVKRNNVTKFYLRHLFLKAFPVLTKQFFFV